jgi:hypothetical protein
MLCPHHPVALPGHHFVPSRRLPRSSCPQACKLWEYLKSTISAQVGAPQATLVQELFCTVIAKGEDPVPHLLKLQSAHSLLNFGIEDLSNEVLPYAMTIALPESWPTQKQSLSLQEPLKSKSVSSAVRAEWQRRVLESGGTGTALKVQGNRPSNPTTSGLILDPTTATTATFPATRIPTASSMDHMKGHSTKTCFSRKNAELNKTKNKPQAKIAQAEDVPTAQVAKLDVNHDSDGSSYITSAIPNNFDSVPSIFIIDSGASHHMVTTLALLTDIKQTTPVSVQIGDGTKLLSRTSGSLILRPVKITNVLVVAGLQANLLSVSQTLSPFIWRSSRYSASLFNDETPVCTATFKADSTPSRRVWLPPLRLQSLTDSQYSEIGTTAWAT